MGWNSWNSYGQTISEADVRANADVMAQKLKASGWQYVVIDEGWYVLSPGGDPKLYQFRMDENGRFLPAESRFPSAKGDGGMKAIADYVHSLGLKFGIHVIRGIPREAVQKNVAIAGSAFHAADAADTSDTCPWNAYNYGLKDNAAGQAYYDSIAKLYASWDVDFIKIDCISSHPYVGHEIRMISEALHKTGRPMVLSLSPGPTPLEKADEVAKYAEMWRISDDFWDHWDVWKGHEWSQGLKAQFDNAANWNKHQVPGHWPDNDMLPLGYLGPHPGEGEPRDSQLTPDEQKTLITLWAISRSPLMMGGNLTKLDAATLDLLTNREVIELNQRSKENAPILSKDGIVVWTAVGRPPFDYYVAVFNRSDTEQTVEYSWNDLKVPAIGKEWPLRDVWANRYLGTKKSLSVKLAPHSCGLYEVILEKH